jgi:uncharacterized protein (TIGR03000 family)
MFGRTLSCGGLLLLAGAVMLGIPSSSQAQRGGARSGGRFGVTRFGGYGDGYPPAYYRPNSGYQQDNGYGSYSTYPGFYGNYSYLRSGTDFGLGYYGVYGSAVPFYFDGDGSATPPSLGSPVYNSPGMVYPDAAPARRDQPVLITVSVHPSAEIWIEGVKTTSTGSTREYQSPPLTPDNRYTYTIRARWKENGREVDRTQQIAVTPGGYLTVSFPTLPATQRASAAGG